MLYCIVPRSQRKNPCRILNLMNEITFLFRCHNYVDEALLYTFGCQSVAYFLLKMNDIKIKLKWIDEEVCFENGVRKPREIRKKSINSYYANRRDALHLCQDLN